jgi:hypothetical protein
MSVGDGPFPVQAHTPTPFHLPQYVYPTEAVIG